MEYELSSTVFENHVCVCIKGRWPAEQQEKIVVEIYNAWAANPRRGLLIDIRGMHDIPQAYLDYQTGRFFEAAGFRNIGRIAILDKPDRRDANKFLKITAYNRGVHLYFFYGDDQEVIDWLGAKEEAENG